jgi:hypothetical protein
MKPVILIGLFLAFGVVCPAQQPQLIDEFGKIYCDDLLARVDNIALKVSERPSTTAYVVISGSSDLLVAKLSLQLKIEAAIKESRLDRSRVTFLEGQGIGELKASVWLSADGSRPPPSEIGHWQWALKRGIKPFIVRTDYGEMCGSSVDLDVISKLLEANPGSRIHAVILGRKAVERREGLRSAKVSLRKS